MTQSLEMLFFFLVCLITASFSGVPTHDPYKTLGVKKKASESEIKKAYRRLVLEYHPDKAKQVRRTEYFNSFRDADSISTRLTAENFESNVYSTYGADKDTVRIWVLYAWSHNCFGCERLAKTWEEFAKNLHKHGIARTGRINAEFETDLNRLLNIRAVPAVMTVRVYGDERPRVTRRSSAIGPRAGEKVLSSMSTLIEVVENVLKEEGGNVHQLLTATGGGAVTRSQLQSLPRRWNALRAGALTNATSAKPLVLVVSKRPLPHLLWAHMAHTFQHTFRVAYICLACIGEEQSRRHAAEVLQLDWQTLDKVTNVDKQTLFAFYHEPELSAGPALAAHNSAERSAIDALWRSHRFLLLPVASEENYYELCFSRHGQRTGRHFCLLLVSSIKPVALAASAPLFRRQDLCRILVGCTRQATAQAQSGEFLQAAWMQPGQQRAFLEAVRAAWPSALRTGARHGADVKNMAAGEGLDMAVLLEGGSREFAVWQSAGRTSAGAPRTLEQWLVQTLAGGGQPEAELGPATRTNLPVNWGGQARTSQPLPFLAPSQTGFFFSGDSLLANMGRGLMALLEQQDNGDAGRALLLLVLLLVVFVSSFLALFTG
eukprot:g27661.t1